MQRRRWGVHPSLPPPPSPPALSSSEKITADKITLAAECLYLTLIKPAACIRHCSIYSQLLRARRVATREKERERERGGKEERRGRDVDEVSTLSHFQPLVFPVGKQMEVGTRTMFSRNLPAFLSPLLPSPRSFFLSFSLPSSLSFSMSFSQCSIKRVSIGTPVARCPEMP